MAVVNEPKDFSIARTASQNPPEGGFGLGVGWFQAAALSGPLDAGGSKSSSLTTPPGSALSA